MTRNLKILGLALVAVLAMGAVVASVASAQQGKFTSDGPVTILAEETGGVGANALTAFGIRIECPGSLYTGHKYNVTPHTFLPNGVTTTTLTPHYKQASENCRANPGNFPVTIHVNGCDYVAHLEGTTPAGNKEDTYGISIDIICPEGKEITATIYTNEHDHTITDKPFCMLHIKEQLGLKGLHVKDTTNGHVDVTGTVEGIHANRTNVHAPILCPNQTTNTAKFDLDITTKGRNEAGESTPVGLSE